MKIIAFANQKGGQAKSLISTQFAFCLAELAEKRVAFIDADEQSSSTYTLRAFEAGNRAYQFFGGEPVKVNGGDSPITLFSADKDHLRLVEKMDDQIKMDANRKVILPEMATNLRARLDEISDRFDWCVIDTPGSNSKVPNATLIAADYVVVPCTIDAYALPVANEMLTRIRAVQQHLNPKLKLIGLLPVRFKANDREMVKHLKELLTFQKDTVLRAKIGDRSAFPYAADHGIPVWKVDRSAAREAAKELREVFDVIGSKVGGF
ncbi:Chromosome (plasmid) partitioning protein ParA / Sporulation initiation inhibitor protein Soj [Candidatus Burkholderia verschuerenii]|uniref:Chromosome (Plasmid) partitioning protein ParA / Sporulation initiation inhibitor protein Soj n=1 Tax=Candidatus Burkholderia verschuerenii TaxID=242163 RepID=A0A0L0MFA2_9BURK|nr:ParA family protein [Candidatus Burkholderia verschuerenii]KND60981.1 Chromosome (plasmid) partitioning protein ParA / Sporulation initiation inhibitor protein Soj [Candidatus Burkholderia verschuerenii]